MSDIKNDDDIMKFVEQFYAKVNKDELLSPVFNDIANVDWDHHLPHIQDFWSTMLFGTGRYNSRPVTKHIGLPIEPQHFEQWLFHFEATVNSLFEGEKGAG